MGRFKRYYDFAVKDLRPRDFSWDNAIGTLIKLTAGQVAALSNWLRAEALAIAAAVIGAVLFLAVFFLCLSLLGRPASLNLPSDLAPKEVPWTAAFITYVLVRFGQHILDWRDWHTPWAHAELDRFKLWPFRHHFPDKEYTCLIVGRGGSGKSTVAQIMENEFLRRKFIKPTGFNDLGKEADVVARSGARIGDDVKEYRISWRADAYKVGRYAEAYDMPGQITADWVKAVREVGPACNRVAIFNVVTYGCNNNIRKFDAVKADFEIPDAGKPDYDVLNKKLIKEGKLRLRGVNGKSCCDGRPHESYNGDGEYLYCCNDEARGEVLGWRPDSRICARYLRDYQRIFREKEAEDFKKVEDAILEWGTNRPKLMLVHVVNMADCWIDMFGTDEEVDEVAKYYVHGELFGPLNDRIRNHLKEKCVVAVVPTSFEFGKTEHESETVRKLKRSDKETGGEKDDNVEKEKLVIFDSTWDWPQERCDGKENAGKKYDEKQHFTVKKQAMLGDMTIKSLRALRKELYRPLRSLPCGPSRNWSGNATIGFPSSRENDVYDRWTHPDFFKRKGPA